MFQGSSLADCGKKKCGFGLLNRSRIRFDWSKIVGTESCKIFKIGLSPRKWLGFHSNFFTYKREALITFWRLLENLCVTLWDLRGFVPFNYTKIYRSQNYNQALVEHSWCIKIITDGDLKPLNGISKSQSRCLVLV